MPQCNAFTASDTRCRMAALKDSTFCMNHNPDYAESNRTTSMPPPRRPSAHAAWHPSNSHRPGAPISLLASASEASRYPCYGSRYQLL